MRDNRPKLKPPPGRDKLIEKIEKMMSEVDDLINSATNKMWWANQELKRLNVEEIGGLQKAFAMETFSKHIRVMREHMKFFGSTENVEGHFRYLPPKEHVIVNGIKYKRI